MSDFLDFVSAGAREGPDASSVAQALQCLDRFTAAFNACDQAAMDAELAFPHTMLSGAQHRVWDGPGQHPPDLFSALRDTGWVSTRYESREAVLVSADKVHFLVTYTRRAAQGEVLSTHKNLWIVTRTGGKWGIALRSY